MNSPDKKRSPLLIGFLVLAGFFTSFILFVVFIFAIFQKKTVITYSDNSIAIIDISGIITDSESIIKQIKKYRDKDAIKGVLLRINSPGGAVAPSQEIYEEVLKLKEYKKVVTSMGTLAASGGYYIACATDKILANPGTITGSIGVIITLSDLSGLMKKIGIKTNVLKSGKFKDIGSPGRELTQEDRKIFQTVIDDIYSQFVEAVTKGRGMDIEEVKKLSDGRIYSGRQAKKLGLVDELGNQEDAVSYLSQMVGIKGEPNIVTEKKEIGLFYRLFHFLSSPNKTQLIPQPKSFGIQYLLPY